MFAVTRIRSTRCRRDSIEHLTGQLENFLVDLSHVDTHGLFEISPWIFEAACLQLMVSSEGRAVAGGNRSPAFRLLGGGESAPPNGRAAHAPRDVPWRRISLRAGTSVGHRVTRTA